MILIAHRINKISQLNNINPKFGIEIDIRDDNKKLIVVHDPFKKGEELNKFLKNFRHKFLIANIKSERIENKLIKIFRKKKINNYFFLDSSFPKIMDLVKLNFKKIALRASYFEGLEPCKKLKGKVEWVWYDTFKGLPKKFDELYFLKKLNYKICLVCPKLHNPKTKLNEDIIRKLREKKIIDAVCTKKKFFKYWN